MLDAIRNSDHLSRVSRKRATDREKAIAYLTQQLQKNPTEEDLETVGVRTRQSPILGTLEKQHHHPRARASRCTLKEAETFREASPKVLVFALRLPRDFEYREVSREAFLLADST